MMMPDRPAWTSCATSVRKSGTPVLVITAYGSVPIAVEAIKAA
jgi:FixJ family two-component response regulator